MNKGKRLEPNSLKGGKSEPAAKAKIGSGKRFAALEKKLESKGIKNPSALAAAIGRAKYGIEKMAKLSSKARKK